MKSRSLLSRIDAVTVYRSGARVVREVVLEAGPDGFPDELRITGLPLSLDDDSVRVAFKAGPGSGEGVPPEAADLRVTLDVPKMDEALAPPKDEEYEAARREVAGIEQELELLNEAARSLDSLRLDSRPPGRKGEPPPPPPMDARLALLEFRRKELDAILEALREKEEALAKARENLDELEFRRSKASSAKAARPHEIRKAAVVRLRTPGEGKGAAAARLRLEYVVPGARWTPAYALHFDRDYTRARVVLRAQVCQLSGEDWKGVDLTLSTALALAWTELPELPSLRIGRRQAPRARTGWREAPVGAETLYADYDRARKASPEPPPPPPLPQPVVERLEDEWAAPEGAVDEDDFYGAPEEEAEECLAEMADMEMEKDAAPMMSMPPPRPKAAPRSAPMKKERRMRAKLDMAPGFASRSAGAPPAPQIHEPEPEPELTASADLLRYGRLRMAMPDAPHRGKLRPEGGESRYAEMLTELRVSVDFSIEARIREQVSEAMSASSVPLPPGHAEPDTLYGFDYGYRAGVRADVPSDNTWHTVPLLEREAETGLLYVSVPRESQDVFRLVSWKNPLSAPLLQGPADVYVGEDYMLTTPLRTVAPGGKVEIGLGVEESIKVARNVRFAEHASGLLKGHLNLEHEIAIDLANNLKRAASMEVRERIPIKRTDDDEIEVNIEEVEPDWAPYDQKVSPLGGSYRWRVTVPPGDKRTLKARYTIEISSKKEIVGGNRRET